MSSLALMRFLESAPARYDWGMKLITFGGVTRVHESIAAQAVEAPGCYVLEIGCGTGAVTERLVERGARVLAIDQNPAMLDVARHRVLSENQERVEWREVTASEIDSLPADAFDSVVTSLCLSEMAQEERSYVLRAAHRALADQGRIVIGDEVIPEQAWKRAFAAIVRLPQLLLAWVLADFWSKPIAHLKDEMIDAGFDVDGEQRWRFGSLGVFSGRKRERTES